MAEDLVQISGRGLSASINRLGAELWTLRDGAGRDLLWNGDAAFWTGRAPILFPIVGTLNGNRYRLDGREYELPRHGFGRRSPFTLVQADPEHARLRLEADDETRAVYPFEFRLDMVFAITGHVLEIAAELTNTGAQALPASFGFHPAFRWPLPDGGARGEHIIRFPRPETAPARRLDGDGLLDPTKRDCPIERDVLAPDDDLFAEDALIFTDLASRSLIYGAPPGPQMHLDFPDMPHLGIWSKPGAPFLCLEPWQGYSDPAGFTGEIWDKPGVVRLEGGECRAWRLKIEISG